MNHRIHPILMLAILSFHILDPSSLARADGGAVRLRQKTGGYQIAVFTSPTPLRAGPVDLSVLIQDAATGEWVPEAQVTVCLKAPGPDPPWNVRQRPKRRPIDSSTRPCSNYRHRAAGMWKLPSKVRTGRPFSGLRLKRTDRRLVGWSYGRGSRGRPSSSLSSAFTKYWFGGGFLCKAAVDDLRAPPYQRRVIFGGRSPGRGLHNVRFRGPVSHAQRPLPIPAKARDLARLGGAELEGDRGTGLGRHRDADAGHLRGAGRLRFRGGRRALPGRSDRRGATDSRHCHRPILGLE